MRSLRHLMIFVASFTTTISCGVQAASFDSGSTGADGAFVPTANTVVPLPPSGVLNYTTVTIPAGVTVRFQRNAANTPVVLLATGLVKITGTINIDGENGTTTTLPVVLGVTNKGGLGGAGGFNGGMGGAPEQNRRGGAGYGPGGGTSGIECGGQGAGSFAGTGNGGHPTYCPNGPTYGSNAMLPVIGGSGGAGGIGGALSTDRAGSGGGGGGGALLVVSSTAVELTGSISARGGVGGSLNSCNGSLGASGSGGMVRIIAPAFSGGGAINVTSQTTPGCNQYGGLGRSSIEVIPNGGAFNLALLPSLAITSIGGQAVPAAPTGSGDVTAPLSLGNPLAVVVSASGIPLGSVVKLTLNNNSGTVTTANTSALAGALQASTATANINIPAGSSVLMASTTYTLTLAQGEALKVYALGEQVEKVSLVAILGTEMKVTLITASGKEFVVPAAVLATLQAELG